MISEGTIEESIETILKMKRNFEHDSIKYRTVPNTENKLMLVKENGSCMSQAEVEALIKGLHFQLLLEIARRQGELVRDGKGASAYKTFVPNDVFSELKKNEKLYSLANLELKNEFVCRTIEQYCQENQSSEKQDVPDEPPCKSTTRKFNGSENKENRASVINGAGTATGFFHRARKSRTEGRFDPLGREMRKSRLPRDAFNLGTELTNAIDQGNLAKTLACAYK